MPTPLVRSAVVIASLVILLIQPSARGQALQPADSASLSSAVSKFLEVWLLTGDPRGAVSGALVGGAFDERFVPAEFYRADDYRKRSAVNEFSTTLSRDEAVNRFAQVLTAWRGPVKDRPTSLANALAPIDEKALPELWAGLRRMDVQPVMLPQLAALTYPMTRPETYEWISSATVGYRSILPEMVTRGLRAQAVVSRIRTPGLSKPWMLFMVWARTPDTTPNAPNQWTLRSVSPVPTE
jgi:hypothetical protein